MTLSCHSRQISSFDTWKVMSSDLTWPTDSENERASWAPKLIFQIARFLNQTTDAETEVGRAAWSDFSPSPVLLHFKRMAKQPKGVSWGKQCQQTSLSHRNSGAVALERNSWSSRKGLAVLWKGSAGYCTSSACFPDVLFFLQGCWAPWFILYAQRKCCSLGTQTTLFNLPRAVLGGLSKLLRATSPVWTRPLLLSVSIRQRVPFSWESQSKCLRKVTRKRLKPCGHEP